MLFMSYGKCTLFLALQETIDGEAQAGLVRFPFKFSSGVMRARFSPKDGQLYMTGLNVWQSDAAKFGGFYRVRYGGGPVHMPAELHVQKAGLQLTFTSPLDEKSATDPENFSISRWNYKWSGAYGSDNYSIADPTKHSRTTADEVPIEAITLSPDKKTLTIRADMVRCMQMKIKYKIQSADGKVLDQEIHNTINKVPRGTT